MRQNYKLTILYDGTRYHGWEDKPGQATIQGKLEGVLARLVGEPVEVIGAGRTDAGVHARGMVANVWLDTALMPEEVRDYLNRYLPEDIGVREVRPAAARFHARYKAVGKTYRYTCYDGPMKPIFDRRYVTRLEQSADVDAMRQGAAYLVGEHDFKSFCGNPHMKKSTVRRVDAIDIVRTGGYLTVTVHGSGFLQHMVRIMVGTLLEVGYGNLPPERVGEILAAKDRSQAGPTAPPEGLCLMKVDY
ncbi:MAG: tRNA pseudouridine(38-40) synthase TruA [Clostridiales bacterium]|nr:tRNA pseudouridine(38-40) synthase TruA [Clostridiales bacterium]